MMVGSEVAFHSQCGPIDSSDEFMYFCWGDVGASLFVRFEQSLAELKVAKMLLHYKSNINTKSNIFTQLKSINRDYVVLIKEYKNGDFTGLAISTSITCEKFITL